MVPLNSSQLLRIWEEGLDQPVMEKTFRLLAAACNTNNLEEISRLSIGERDARLLRLREWMFGKHLKNISSCPACGEKIEWETNAEDLHLQTLPANLSVKTFTLSKDGFVVAFRLPDSNDIIKAMNEPLTDKTNKVILATCIVNASQNGKKIESVELPEQVWNAIDQRMSEEDPQADISMNIHCPSCKHQWEAKFDIVSFLWAEINNWARQMLLEVYQLSRFFGWSESDILKMSPRRRQLYLQMIGT